MKRKLSPPPYEAGECSSSGSRRPGHPHSTPWSCERAKTKLTTHVMQDSTPCPRQYLHASLLCRGALCRVSHQPGKYGIKTKIKTVRALIFLARRIQPVLSLVDREVKILCTNDFLIDLHLLGIFFFFEVRKIPFTGIRTHVPTCWKVTSLPLSYPGDHRYNVGEKPTVICTLYHARPPKIQNKLQCST